MKDFFEIGALYKAQENRRYSVGPGSETVRVEKGTIVMYLGHKNVSGVGQRAYLFLVKDKVLEYWTYQIGGYGKTYLKEKFKKIET